MFEGSELQATYHVTAKKAFTAKRPCVFRVACAHCAAERHYRIDEVRQFRAEG